ncbi:hypothetical protein [Massilia aerilata]|uniref:Conjugal transfer protein TrbJ n=1 Tax=Massilia aerilata TaxID=453817 RepID=A0ABW0S3B2_9BURK
MNKYIKHLIVAAAACAVTLPASALFGIGDITFDPTNWIQNNSAALAGVRNEVNTAKALIQQTQAAINMAKSVKAITDMDRLAQVKEALGLYKQLQSVDGRLENDFQQSAELTERVKAKYGASNMSWEEYVTSRDQLELQQRETSAQRYRAINASMQQTASQRQAIVNRLNTVGGQTEAIQALGASIDVLIGQNQQIISILAANQRIADTKRQDEVRDENKSSDETIKLLNARQQRLRDAAAKY